MREAFVDFPWAPAGAAGPLAFGAPVEIVEARCLDEVRPALDRVAAACADGRYAVGFVSYEAAPAFDPAMAVRSGSGVPLVWFGLHDAPLAEGAAREPAAYACSVWEAGTDEVTYAASVAAVREAIASGDTYQVNHTMRLRARFDGDPLGAWADLRRAQRDGWFAYVDTGAHAVASVSPELFFTWDGHEVVTRPMKGTRARSRDGALDAARAADLRASAKDRAENLMIVDLLRNDLQRVCRAGTVDTVEFMTVRRYSHIMHLESTVVGELKEGVAAYDVLVATFPAGTLSGAPKPRAMALIDEYEGLKRGIYGGVVGYLDFAGDLDMAIAIRTAVIRNGVAHVQAGAGIVADSVPQLEHEECQHKAAAVLRAVQAAAGMQAAVAVSP